VVCDYDYCTLRVLTVIVCVVRKYNPQEHSDDGTKEISWRLVQSRMNRMAHKGGFERFRCAWLTACKSFDVRVVCMVDKCGRSRRFHGGNNSSSEDVSQREKSNRKRRRKKHRKRRKRKRDSTCADIDELRRSVKRLQNDMELLNTNKLSVRNHPKPQAKSSRDGWSGLLQSSGSETEICDSVE